MKVVTKLIVTGLLLVLLVPIISSMLPASISPEQKSGQVTLTSAAGNTEGIPSVVNVLSPVVEIVSLDIPDKYSYLYHYHLINSEIEGIEEVLAITKVFDEEGININAHDVNFYVIFNDEGLISDVRGGLNTEYRTIKIHEDLDKFGERLLETKDAKDIIGLLTDVTLPLKYYIKLPAAILASNIN